MAHKLDMTHGRANIAFKGSRENVWHRLGTEMTDGMTTDEWAKAAGMEWEAIKVPAVVELSGPEFDHLNPSDRKRTVEGWNHLVRSDNGHPLGYVSDGYCPVNPREILNWFERYISVDERFSLDVAGCLKKGEIVWATATYNGTMDVGGSAHVARVLMRTTMDCSGATINMGTMTRVVCDNTMRAALDKAKAIIRTRHSTRFNAAAVGKELAAVCKSFDEFKAMGDALATNEMVASEVHDFFAKCLDVPSDAKESELSGRKLNMFHALNDAYRATVNEGTEKNTAWTALNAVTRYVDHERSTRGGGASVDEARMISSMFGSGAALKDKALGLLLPRIKEKVLA